MDSAFEVLAAETSAYAAYVNAPRGVLDGDEQQLLDEDLARARAAMERAWLEAKPVRDAT
jgi:hypothetical protein